jgi:hypothetical protein
MRRWLLAVAALAAPTVNNADAAPEKVAGWQSDYQAARAEARRTGKPLFVVLRCVP